MKTYAINVTIIWMAENQIAALEEFHKFLVWYEDSSNPGGYQGYRDMTAEEVPDKADASA